MSTKTAYPSTSFELAPQDNQRLANLCGERNHHLQQIEKHFDVEIRNRGHKFEISGKENKNVKAANDLVHKLYKEASEDKTLTPEKIHVWLQDQDNQPKHHLKEADKAQVFIPAGRVKLRARGDNQCQYVKNIQDFDVNFAIGPAGTGKTYLAVACAVAALQNSEVERLILVRPAVEAGERLGFLPGDLSQKVNPYLRPLYDALYEFLGTETVLKLIEQNTIELAPLAYMRGRTLNDAFIILDEGQNTTTDQMKMFLTRLGFGSKAVITGDITQVDLPAGVQSGLIHAEQVLHDIPALKFNYFNSHDVVRHRLVRAIIDAYERKQF